jgi:hypothetical protein
MPHRADPMRRTLGLEEVERADELLKEEPKPPEGPGSQGPLGLLRRLGRGPDARSVRLRDPGSRAAA